MRVSIILFSLLFFLFPKSNAQQAFIGGQVGFLPIIDASNYTLDTIPHLGTGASIAHLKSSSDHSYIYVGTTAGNFGATLSLYKIDAITKNILSTLPIPYQGVDLEITDDDQYLFYDVTRIVGGLPESVVYKLNTNTMSIVDSMTQLKNVNFIKINDNNSFYYSTGSSFTGYKLYKADFGSHTLTDSILLNEGMSQFVINEAKTHIYGISDIPNELYKIDLVAKTVDTTVVLDGTVGSVYDIIFNEDESKLYLNTQGNSASDPGMLRVIRTNDLSTITDIAVDYGLGELALSPNGELWCLQSHNKTISVIDPSNNAVIHSFSNNQVVPRYIAFGNGTGMPTAIKFLEMAEDLTVFPNPTTTHTTIALEQGHHYLQLKVFDALGQLMMEQQISGRQQVTLELENKPTGIYFLHFFTEQGTSTIRTISKK